MREFNEYTAKQNYSRRVLVMVNDMIYYAGLSEQAIRQNNFSLPHAKGLGHTDSNTCSRRLRSIVALSDRETSILGVFQKIHTARVQLPRIADFKDTS